ncbi:MAG: LamG-like jellyroll fold domain-containing protein [Chitinophagales bacterium]|jgi:alpha-tubulin suppressor-like RCC1 family protein/pimeloyl-ACP methyl ester carboxylesterase|nr:T9SS type A sorting domain-containing protein [Sphingobacteriales bacterium]
MKNLITLILSLFFLSNICGQGCWKEISSGSSHTLAIKKDGTLWAWGSNMGGQLGVGNYIDKYSPVQVDSNNNWVSCSTYHGLSAAIKSDSSLWVWGHLDNWPTLPIQNIIDTSRPIKISLSKNWKQVSVGADYLLCIKYDGTLWGIGSNYNGKLGNNSNNDLLTLTQIGTENQWNYIQSGTYNSYAIKKDGTLWAWGENLSGTIGDNTLISKNFPVQIGTDNNWLKVIGLVHVLALKSDSTLWSWGYNGQGQLGIGNRTNKLIPTKVGIAKWIDIRIGDGTGRSYSEAIKSDGTLWWWGLNDYQITNLSIIDTTIPVKITGLSNLKTVNGKYRSSFILNQSDSLFAFGFNSSGQLGDSTTTNRTNPTLIQCPTPPNPSGLIGYYPFNSNASDESGSNNHGTFSGATLGVDRFGLSNKCSEYNTSTSAVNYPYTALNNLPIGSISLWFYGNSGTNNTLLDKTLTNTMNYFQLKFASNKIQLAVNNPYGNTTNMFSSNGTLPTNQWNHVVITWNGTEIKMYLNKTLDKTISSTQTIGNINRTIKSGNDDGFLAPFSGKIDDIRIYNKALNQSEVISLFDLDNNTDKLFPSISLSNTLLQPGNNLNITGTNFTPNYSDTLNIYSFQAQTNIKIHFTTNSLGVFTQSLNINTNDKGRHLVSIKDTIKNQPITSQMYEVSTTPVNTSSERSIKIVSPTSKGISFDVMYDNTINLTWADKIVDKSKLITNTAWSYKYFNIEYKINGGSWQTAFSQSYQVNGVYLETKFFNQSYTFGQSGNYQFRISEKDNPNNWDTSIVFLVKNSNVAYMRCEFDWDFSGNRPATVSPKAICADGTARIYIKMVRNNHNNINISSIKATVVDDDNLKTEPMYIGKLMKADYVNKYDTSANTANSTSAIFDNLKDDKKSEYYFWYVAPDNFVRDWRDTVSGERLVQFKIEVKYADNTIENYTKSIAIYRPPLMLVHGWMSDENTWDKFMYQNASNTYTYKDAHHLFKAGIRRNNMLKSNQYMDNGLILVSQFLPNSFAYQVEQARSRGIACNKVDYICHSMGGCMVRTAINMYPDDYNPPINSTLKFKNYNKGFTNKIITINTPHNGSTGADLIDEQLPKMNYARSIILSAFYDFSDIAQHIYKPYGYNPKYPLHLYFKPSHAVSNMQFKNNNPNTGGVRFSETKNIKGFMISSKFSEDENDAIVRANSSVYANSLVYKLYDLMTKDDEFSYSHSFVYYVNRKMKSYGVDNFMSNSDFVVPITSQLIDGKLTATKKYHKIFNGDNSMHTEPHTRLDVGQFCLFKLNDDITSDRFTNSFPKNDSSGGIRLKSASIKPADSTVEKFNDTTKYKLLNSIASLNYVDSTIAIQINAKDTNKLLANTIVFQGQMYFNKLEKGNLLYLLKVNPNYIDSQLLVTTLTYDSAGYNVHYNMTYPIKIVPQDTLRSLTCEPRLKYLNANEDYHPTIYANFGKYISNISLNNSDVSVSIADPNVMSFNGNLLVAKDTGSTYVVVSYRGLKDTTYYVVTPPIEIVPDACIPPTVDFDYTLTGKTILLNNKSTNATSYKWKLSNGTILTDINPNYTFTDTGEYLICLTSYNTCDSTKICQTLKITANSSNISNSMADNIFVYPNPTKGNITIELPNLSYTTYKIVNLLGQTVESGKLLKLRNDIQLNCQSKGIYQLELMKDSGEVISKKLIIE